MKLNQELIKKLAETEIALLSNGVASEISTILRAACPGNTTDIKYLTKSYYVIHGTWYYGNDRNLPEVNAVDFFIEEGEVKDTEIEYTESLGKVMEYLAGTITFNQDIMNEFFEARSVIEIDSKPIGHELTPVKSGRKYNLQSLRDYYTIMAIFSKWKTSVLPVWGSEAYYIYSTIHKNAWSACKKIFLQDGLRELPRRKLSEFILCGNPLDEAPLDNKEFIEKMISYMDDGSGAESNEESFDKQIMSDIIDEHVTYAGIDESEDNIKKGLEGEPLADVQDTQTSCDYSDPITAGDLALFWSREDMGDLELMKLIGVVNTDGNCEYFAIQPYSNSVSDVRKYRFITHRFNNNLGVKVFTLEEIANSMGTKLSELRIYDGKRSIINL